MAARCVGAALTATAIGLVGADGAGAEITTPCAGAPAMPADGAAGGNERRCVAVILLEGAASNAGAGTGGGAWPGAVSRIGGADGIVRVGCDAGVEGWRIAGAGGGAAGTGGSESMNSGASEGGAGVACADWSARVAPVLSARGC